MQAERLLEIIGADFYTGVPDSQLKALCDCLYSKYGTDPKKHIIAANVLDFHQIRRLKIFRQLVLPVDQQQYIISCQENRRRRGGNGDIFCIGRKKHHNGLFPCNAVRSQIMLCLENLDRFRRTIAILSIHHAAIIAQLLQALLQLLHAFAG